MLIRLARHLVYGHKEKDPDILRILKNTVIHIIPAVNTFFSFRNKMEKLINLKKEYLTRRVFEAFTATENIYNLWQLCRGFRKIGDHGIIIFCKCVVLTSYRIPSNGSKAYFN